jgi:hypothetical protein
MKTTTLLMALVFAGILFACSPPREVTQRDSDDDGLIAGNDTTEYELLIFDRNFDTWFMMNRRHISYYEKEYLETWNARLVHQWNNFTVGSGRTDCRPMTYIDYNPSIDYGKELNYQLFYYFWYMQRQCRLFHSRPGEWR